LIALIQNSALRLEEYLRTGGPIMVPLVIVSLAMWLLIIDRAIFFRRIQRRDMNSRNALEYVARDRQPDLRQYRGATAVLVAEFIRRRSGRRSLDRFVLDETVARLQRTLTDHLAAIGVLAAIAPLLGLLGTVSGMITTFDVLAVFGTGNARAMAGGISEALITTQTGLLVAIPGLYMKGFLDRRARQVAQRLSAVGFYLRRHL
jgi:biopolymer transport protein ExbB